MRNKLSFALLSLLLLVSPCLSLGYDGIFFLGFNLEKEPFNNVYVRQAVAHAVDMKTIVKLASAEIVPGSVIPPGMTGYQKELLPYSLDLKQAKVLMRRGKYLPVNPKLKNISLLHTDGVKTTAIAKEVQNNLRAIGIKVSLFQVKYQNELKWNEELVSRRHHLYLLGYKTDLIAGLTMEAAPDVTDTYKLLEPLFHSKGAVNLSGFNNSTIDMLLDQVSVIGYAYQLERDLKLKEVNKVLYQELPALVLFYIPKL